MTDNDKRVAALRALLQAIEEACKVAGPMGAPGGVMYAALMSYGITLNQFYQLTGALIRAGKITQQGDCYVTA